MRDGLGSGGDSEGFTRSMQSWVLGQCQSYWPNRSLSCATLAQVSAGVGCDVPVSPGIKESQHPGVEKAMSPRSSTLAWKIPRMEEPDRLWPMGLQRVRHD